MNDAIANAEAAKKNDGWQAGWETAVGWYDEPSIVRSESKS